PPPRTAARSSTCAWRSRTCSSRASPPPALAPLARGESLLRTPSRRPSPPAAAGRPAGRGEPLPAPPPDAAAEPAEPAQRLALPRAVWIACVTAAVAWQCWIGHSGVALLALAALAPLLVLPAEPRSTRVGAGWLVCALAPILGLAGLA